MSAMLLIRVRALLGAAALAFAIAGDAVAAASLDVSDGVVVKFGQDAGITVRDTLHAGKNVVFTSLKDDTVGGQTNPIAQTAIRGAKI